MVALTQSNRLCKQSQNQSFHVAEEWQPLWKSPTTYGGKDLGLAKLLWRNPNKIDSDRGSDGVCVM